MTKGTKIFRIIICILLALTMLWSAFLGVLLIAAARELVLTTEYDIWVAGEPVTRYNAGDVLGDGTVWYDAYNNTIIFENAVIESERNIIFSAIDLNVELIGENKFICTNEEYGVGIYAGDNHLSKDLAIMGDGSLNIELPNKSSEALGIFAADLTVNADVTVITPDCENMVNGIGAAKNGVGVRVRGNALLDEGTALKVSVNPGTAEICKGLSVSGDLFLGKDTSLEVSLDDASTDLGECIRVTGFMDIGADSKVAAHAKNAHAIECYGAIKANKGAVISAVSDKKDSDIFCGGAIIDHGADIEAEIDAVGGICNKNEN